MIQSLATVIEEQNTDVGDEVTVRCRVRSDPMPGKTGGSKTVYMIDDPYNDIGEDAALAFWTDEPPHSGLRQTEPCILSTLSLSDDEVGTENKGASLQRGEEILVRGLPNRRDDDEAFYLNVTSFVIRDPSRLISKSKLRAQDRCPREYYLRYIKRVYPGDKFDKEGYQRESTFRGNAVHKITENALDEKLDRFQEKSWSKEDIQTYCEEQFATEFGFEQALLVLSGIGLDVREHIVEAVKTLFTDNEFLCRVGSATEVGIERYLSNEYGYAGRVDVLLDGTPYDIKTTRNPNRSTVNNHRKQIKLYLFALLLDQIERGESFWSAVDAGRTGYLVYPNTIADEVRFEKVELHRKDVREFLHGRNNVIETGDAFAPPSTYNRECDGCSFADEEWVSGPDDTLPPACTYHCQNERRWPCYETNDGTMTTQCSLFDTCDQRSIYREPETINHYESVRATFQKEKRARITASRAINKFDHDLLIESGYRIPDLRCVGASAAGTIIHFETPVPTVPAFEPGEVVEIKSSTENNADRAVYFGRDKGQFLFSPLEPSVDVTDFISPETTFSATCTFNIDAIDSRHLPYLDFAQRRNGGDRLDTTATDDSSVSVPDSVSPSDVAHYLGHRKLFVDLPVSTTRNQDLEQLIHQLVTVEYPHPDKKEQIPDEGCRALVLASNPEEADTAVAAQPDGNHFRLDGTGGSKAIRNEDGYHRIQTRLLNSRSIVSTVQQATGRRGPGGIREFFHRLEEGQFGDRDHSENFFDVLILLSAEQLTEPEYHFLSDLADRIIAIGDSRRSGPRLLSDAATEAGLDSYFEQQYERYRSFPTNQTVSLQLKGEAPPALRTFYRDGPWREIEGEIQFLPISGDEETAIDIVELEASVPAATGVGIKLVFDITDTPISPMAAHELFETRLELDASALREKSTVIIDDESFYLESKDRLEGESPTHHQVVIRAVASELPQFSRALLSNKIAERIVAQVVAKESPDRVVTPFDRHATLIARRLDELDVEVPVCRPEELDGTVAEHVVVSLATANDVGIVRPPLDNPEVLYLLLASGRKITLVGNERTLRSKDIFDELIDKSSIYNQ